MATPKEQSESAPLPRPELNPLLNPLLAENMGRWAEVYFTAAPEKREEAVGELLRELESGGPGAQTTLRSPTATQVFQPPQFPSPDFSAEDFARSGRQFQGHCHACGHDNPSTHQFCGMCGEKLFSEDETRDPDYRDRTSERGSESTFSDSFEDHRSELGYGTTPEVEREAAPAESDELSRLRRISDGSSGNTSNFDWDLESSHSGQRHIYLALGVVVVVLALVYIAWRGSRASQNAHQVSAAPPVALNEPAQVPPANEDARGATALRTQPAAAAPAINSSNDRADNRHEDQGAAVKPTNSSAPPLSDEKKPAEMRPVASGNGEEELALAQRYLSGGTGIQRNSTEAAQWLWKSVAKHNSEAPLLLADLYLRGDGVSKNCEQARVLLDSAARKGVAGAGARLRNLQAFGCQ